MFTAVAFLNKGAFSAPFEGADQEAPSGYVSRLVGDKQEKFPYDWKTAGNARFERRDEPTATFSPNAPTVNNKVYETTVNPPAGRSVPLPGDKRGEPTATFIPGDKRDEPTTTFTPEAKFPNDWSTPGNARFLEAAQTLTV